MAKRPPRRKTSAVSDGARRSAGRSASGRGRAAASAAAKSRQDASGTKSFAAERIPPACDRPRVEQPRPQGPCFRLLPEAFGDLLKRISPDRRIAAIRLHVTGCPDHAQDLGRETLEAMRRFHTRHLGLADIAQHLTVDRRGTIWTGRHWDRAPVSVAARNGDQKAGPLMIAIIGDFRRGLDVLDGPQREALLVAIALLLNRFELAPTAIQFAWHMSSRQVPGETIERGRLLREVDETRVRIARSSATEKEERRSPFDDSAVDRGEADEAAQMLLRPAGREPDALEEFDVRDFSADQLVLLTDRPRESSGDVSTVPKTVFSVTQFPERKGVSMFRAFASLPEEGTREAFATRGGTRKALCIGINAYPRNALSGCVNDAKGWAQCLEKLGFETTMLLDRQASYRAILDAIGQKVTSARAGDVIVIQYSGHGTQLPNRGAADESDGQDEALVPVDFDRGYFVIDDDLAEICNRIPQGVNVTFFMDCCHSGTNTRLFAGVGETQGDGEGVPRFIVPTEADMKAYRNLRGTRSLANARSPYSGQREILFAACRSDQTAKERNGQGDFTRNALRVLSQNASGMTNADFMDRVRKLGGFNDQMPQLWSDDKLWTAQFLNASGGAGPASQPPSTPSGSAVGSAAELSAKLDDILNHLRGMGGGNP